MRPTSWTQLGFCCPEPVMTMARKKVRLKVDYS